MNQIYRVFLFLSTAVFLFTLAACQRASPEAPPVETAAAVPPAVLGINQPLAGHGVLVCTPECSDRAQCGYLNDVEPVVLLGRGEPRVSEHNAFAFHGTTADILEMQTITLQNNATAEQYPAPFYRIRTTDLESAWVAGWCIQQ